MNENLRIRNLTVSDRNTEYCIAIKIQRKHTGIVKSVAARMVRTGVSLIWSVVIKWIGAATASELSVIHFPKNNVRFYYNINRKNSKHFARVLEKIQWKIR